MKQENIKQWGSLVCFIILAGISCWATEHSFHLLIQWMPEAFLWGLTIAFFILASYGTKLIVDALNKDIWMDHRRRAFWIGTILVIVFWLLMSMPTNTHTFFYNHNIGNVAQEDLTQTSKYLTQLNERQNVDSAYYVLHDKEQKKFTELTDEFNGIGRSGKKGSGEYVRQIMRDINGDLEKELPGSSVKFNDAAWNQFDPQVLSSYEAQMNRSLEQIKDKNYMGTESAAKEAAEDLRKIGLMGDTIKVMVESGNIYEDVIIQADGVVLSGYANVKSNQKYVKFENDADKQHYTQENLETRIKRMLSVIDVWLDFFAGKYPVAFFFYILLSILVDVAAFMFFDFAFKRKE